MASSIGMTYNYAAGQTCVCRWTDPNILLLCSSSSFRSKDHDKRQLTDGTLTTSLVGDIYGYIAFVLKTLRDRLTSKSEAMIQLVTLRR